MRSLVLLFLATSLLLSACKRTTPAEMVFGHWKVKKITESGKNVSNEYLNKNNKYISIFEEGYVQVGLLDSTKSSTWLIYEDENEILLPELYFQDVKRWKVIASDEHIELSDQNNIYTIYLTKIDEKPEPSISSKEQLIGKWIVDKVTINGADNTNEYAHTKRWILINSNGRYYNGAEDKKQATGFWETDESLTHIRFAKSLKEDASNSLDFQIAENNIWYQKEKSHPTDPSVRIYFKRIN